MSARPSGLEAARRRYQWLAAVYDYDLGQRFLYAQARSRAVELLRLSPGSAILDVACGTGRNFSLIEARIGQTGRLVGVDLTPAMLARARFLVEEQAWNNVELIEMDAADLSLGKLVDADVVLPGQRFDAAISTLGLSVIPEWQRAFKAMLSVVRPGGRIAVMDAGYSKHPRDAGAATVLRPLMAVIARLAAADSTRQPWLPMINATEDTTIERFAMGYVTVAVGTVKAERPTSVDANARGDSTLHEE